MHNVTCHLPRQSTGNDLYSFQQKRLLRGDMAQHKIVALHIFFWAFALCTWGCLLGMAENVFVNPKSLQEFYPE